MIDIKRLENCIGLSNTIYKNLGQFWEKTKFHVLLPIDMISYLEYVIKAANDQLEIKY